MTPASSPTLKFRSNCDWCKELEPARTLFVSRYCTVIIHPSITLSFGSLAFIPKTHFAKSDHFDAEVIKDIEELRKIFCIAYKQLFNINICQNYLSDEQVLHQHPHGIASFEKKMKEQDAKLEVIKERLQAHLLQQYPAYWQQVMQASPLAPIQYMYKNFEIHTLPNLVPQEPLKQLKEWIEKVKHLAYQDFDNRIGICWDDYWLCMQKEYSVIVDPHVKKVEGKIQYPLSLFSDPLASNIVLKYIVDPFLKVVQEHAQVPSKVYMQTFILRTSLTPASLSKEGTVHWHQDPSEYGGFADYTLVLMLSDPFDPNLGWEGGKLLLKSGKPDSTLPSIELTPRYNQALVFNNQKNSHAVTGIDKVKNPTCRDIVILNVYLKDPSQK